MHHLLPDALLAGEAIRAGLLGAAAAPGWGAAGMLALVAPVLAGLLAWLVAPAAWEEGEARPAAATLDGATSPRGLRLVALVCGAIAALFALVSAEALGVVPLSAVAGLLVGSALFAAFAWRCWGMASRAAAARMSSRRTGGRR